MAKKKNQPGCPCCYNCVRFQEYCTKSAYDLGDIGYQYALADTEVIATGLPTSSTANTSLTDCSFNPVTCTGCSGLPESVSLFHFAINNFYTSTPPGGVYTSACASDYSDTVVVEGDLYDTDNMHELCSGPCYFSQTLTWYVSYVFRVTPKGDATGDYTPPYNNCALQLQMLYVLKQSGGSISSPAVMARWTEDFVPLQSFCNGAEIELPNTFRTSSASGTPAVPCYFPSALDPITVQLQLVTP